MKISNETIEEYFNSPKNSEAIHPELFRLFKIATLSHKFTENSMKNPVERLLVFYSVLNSVYQIFIDYNDESILEFGIELQKKNKLNEFYKNHQQTHKLKNSNGDVEFRRVKDISIKDTNFSFYSLYLNHQDNKLLIYFLIPTTIPSASSYIQTILPILKTTIISEPKNKENKCHQIYSDFKRDLQSHILGYNYKEKVYGVVAHFFIEDLTLYSDYMGEQFTKQILEEVKNKIQNHLKKQDIMYIINRRSFLTFLPECDIATVENRFKDVFFKIDPLFIRYQLDFYEVDEKNAKSIEFYDHFLSHEFTNHSSYR
ncbi:MAG: hypothetical protein KDK36_04100 [Leptospiraceae bacterium]|nr:hypothetical protein [Leptospiraceae bacterium]